MEERSVTVDGTTHRLAAPFQVLATMNPLDHQGTYALPAAQIDRFMVMLEVGYPSADDEVRMLDRHLAAEPALAGVRPVIARDDLVDWQATVPLIHVAPAVKRAAVEWVHALRAESPDRPTVSPRATLAWVRLGAGARADARPRVRDHRRSASRSRPTSCAIACGPTATACASGCARRRAPSGARREAASWRGAARAARIATLFVPSLAAWALVRASCMRRSRRRAPARGGSAALVPLFCVMAAALAVRAVEAAGARRSWAEALDILTAPGRALVWTAAAAIGRRGRWSAGRASPCVGLLGLGVAYVMATWAALVAAGEEPWRALTVTRARLRRRRRSRATRCASSSTVGGARVPAGFRLLVRGGVARHASAAYILESDISDGDISLDAELGPARRGEYDVPPAELWLQDLFGLTRSRVVRLGAGKLTVLPRPVAIDELAAVAAARGDDADSVPAQKLPTEGCFRLRAYTTGDDARRIHWVRSLMARELVVRLPDELPPEQPMVRLVLDTQLVGAAALPTPATGQLCDALVRMWLSAGQALVARGVRVTMVAAVDEPARVVERAMTPQSAGALARVGARVGWQGALPLERMLGDGARNIVVSARPRPLDGDATSPGSWCPSSCGPIRRRRRCATPGRRCPIRRVRADNRWTRRRREKRAHEETRRAGELFDQLCQWRTGRISRARSWRGRAARAWRWRRIS